MTKTESLIPGEWYAYDARDLSAAQLPLAGPDDLLGVAGMLLQQAVEKYLKGHLLSKGWRLARTHDLGLLLKDLVSYEPDFQVFADACLRITDFYFEDRYPLGASQAVARSELGALFAQAEALIARILAGTDDGPSSRSDALPSTGG